MEKMYETWSQTENCWKCISGVILNTFLNYKIVTLKLQWENADDFYKVPKTQNGICWVSHE